MAEEPPTKKAKVQNLGTLTYFPLLAKGLAPTLCAELSGLAWKGNKDTGFAMDKWADLKASGKPPFGQLPILETGSSVIGQSTAICSYIGHVAGTDGQDGNEYAMSQMLMAEGEDLYNLMQKFQPTIFAKDKSEDDVIVKFWAETVPPELKKLDKLLGSKTAFTKSGTTVGELYVFAMIHQMVVVSSDCLDETPSLKKFYDSTKALPGVKKVLDGGSSMGSLDQYFIQKA
jgi:glutathione S-transferase